MRLDHDHGYEAWAGESSSRDEKPFTCAMLVSELRQLLLTINVSQLARDMYKEMGYTSVAWTYDIILCYRKGFIFGTSSRDSGTRYKGKSSVRLSLILDLLHVEADHPLIGELRSLYQKHNIIFRYPPDETSREML